MPKDKNSTDADMPGKDSSSKGKTFNEFSDERLYKKRVFDNYLGTIMQ